MTSPRTQLIWHPCSQMKDYETFTPLLIKKARGCHIELANGTTIIDAISSWWCKSLGHNHPRLKAALLEQADKFEHVILANTTNETIATLSQQLAQLMPPLNKIFYASDGSCAIEVALKMSIQARMITGETHRTKFIALENSYHGETTGALSVSDVGLYRAPFTPLLFTPHFLTKLPYVNNMHDLLWEDCSLYWPAIEKKLLEYADTATAIIIEPILQGAGGMKIYSKDFLKRIAQFAKLHNIHLIADEIMTGIGRTGNMFACEYANVIPDFLCLGKGLTSGWLPLSAVLTHDAIYQLFYDDYETGKSFLHSHTQSGNALAACIASEVLTIFKEENICEKAAQLGKKMLRGMQQIARDSQQLQNVRNIGAMVAADLICDFPTKRHGYTVYQEAVKRGALLRPLGNTIYWLPPLIMDDATLTQLQEITFAAIMATSTL